MCSDPVDPGGEVRSCYVSFTTRMCMWDMASFVLIIAAGPYIGFLEQIISCNNIVLTITTALYAGSVYRFYINIVLTLIPTLLMRVI